MSTLDKFMRIFSIFADNVARIILVKVQKCKHERTVHEIQNINATE